MVRIQSPDWWYKRISVSLISMFAPPPPFFFLFFLLLLLLQMCFCSTWLLNLSLLLAIVRFNKCRNMHEPYSVCIFLFLNVEWSTVRPINYVWKVLFKYTLQDPLSSRGVPFYVPWGSLLRWILMSYKSLCGSLHNNLTQVFLIHIHMWLHRETELDFY